MIENIAYRKDANEKIWMDVGQLSDLVVLFK